MLNKYWLYLQERFPLSQFLPLSILIGGGAAILSQVYVYQSVVGWFKVSLSASALFLLLMRLRIWDEHKDWVHDRQHYPNRPVIRGLVKLKELQNLLLAILGFEIVIALSMGINSFIWFGVMLGYSWLMYQEFFIRDWLKKHFTSYIISHEILLIPLFWYLMSLNVKMGFWEMLTNYFAWLLIAYSGGQLFMLEVARKIRGPKQETASRDTYSAQYGPWRATWLLWILAFFSIGAGLQIGAFIDLPLNIYYVSTLFVLVCFVFISVKYMQQPAKFTSKKLFNATISLFVINTLALLTSVWLR